MSEDDADEWEDWYRLSPRERWSESMKLWDFYLSVGGSLEAEPDSQSPFDTFMPRSAAPAYGGQACVFYGAAEFSMLSWEWVG